MTIDQIFFLIIAFWAGFWVGGDESAYGHDSIGGVAGAIVLMGTFGVVGMLILRALGFDL